MTPRWRALRDEAMERDGYRCVGCRKIGLTVAAELVHHVRPIRQGGDPFDIDNLESLCRRCHAEEHAEKLAPARQKWADLVTQTLEAKYA